MRSKSKACSARRSSHRHIHLRRGARCSAAELFLTTRSTARCASGFYRGYMTEYYDSEMATDYVEPDWNAIKGLAFRLALAVFAFCVIVIGVVSRLRLNAERRRIGNAVGQFMLSDSPEAGIPNEIAVPLSDAKSKLMLAQTLLREETARKNDLVMYLAHDLKNAACLRHRISHASARRAADKPRAAREVPLDNARQGRAARGSDKRIF